MKNNIEINKIELEHLPLKSNIMLEHLPLKFSTSMWGERWFWSSNVLNIDLHRLVSLLCCIIILCIITLVFHDYDLDFTTLFEYTQMNNNPGDDHMNEHHTNGYRSNQSFNADNGNNNGGNGNNNGGGPSNENPGLPDGGRSQQSRENNSSTNTSGETDPQERLSQESLDKLDKAQREMYSSRDNLREYREQLYEGDMNTRLLENAYVDYLNAKQNLNNARESIDQMSSQNGTGSTRETASTQETVSNREDRLTSLSDQNRQLNTEILQEIGLNRHINQMIRYTIREEVDRWGTRND